MLTKVLRNLEVSILPDLGLVISMSREDKEVVATVEGNLCVPSQGVIEAGFTPTPDPKE